MANVSSSNGLEKRPKLRFPGFDEPWERKTLSGLSKIVKGEQLPSTDVNPEGLFYHLNGGVSPSSRTDKFNVDANTISISEGGNSCGYVNWNPEPFFSGGHNYTLQKIVEEVSPYFLYEALKSKQTEIMALRVGSGLPNIQKKDIEKFPLYIPSKKEQNHIADFLRLVDSKVEEQSLLINNLKKYKRGLLSNLFGEKITQGCTTKSYYFSEIAQRRSEKYDPSSGIEYPCVELENIEQETGKILATVPSTAQSSIKNIAMPGDTLFGKLRPYLRKYAFAKKTMACSSEIWALIPSDVVLPKFLFYLVQTEHFLRVANISSGTKMPRAEWSNIEKAEFFIPDFSVQRKVVSLLEGLDQKITFADSTLLSLNRLKASLLQHLFI